MPSPILKLLIRVAKIQLSEYGYMVLSQTDENEAFGDILQVVYGIGDSHFLTRIINLCSYHFRWCEIKLW